MTLVNLNLEGAVANIQGVGVPTTLLDILYYSGT